MFQQIIIVLLATLVITVFLSTQHSLAEKVECSDVFDDMEWDPKDHEPSDPSTNEFEYLAYHGSLCEISKCIDHEECTNRDEVNWEKFQNSPGYELSYADQKKCLEASHKDGNGKEGLVGYEILACGMGEDRY